MALVCSKCRSDNADGALVCRHCGASLQAKPAWGRSLMPDDDSFDPLSAPTLVMQHTAPASLPPIEESPLAEPPAHGTGRRKAVGLAVVVVLAAGGIWLLRPGDDTPPAPAPATVARPASAATAIDAAPVASAPAPTAAAAPSASMAAAPASAALPTQEAASAMGAEAAEPASVPERRKRLPEPVPRPRAQQTLRAAPPAQAVPPAAAAAPASAPAPARLKTVAELCAGNNLLMRGFCEQRECRKAEFAADAACVKLKETEQRRLFQQ
ncbi:hypothetical protein [uncultured Piscinibacter sp.]|uniref:hypothetical protein n=1 Tax=uncultured Piscinibacter sp. TaxID=1131835 RepID=UPI00261D0731|nr:hypothetical protein [uncultured Piscinibacter sp.]